MDRRKFIKISTSITIFLTTGEIITAKDTGFAGWEKRKIKLRFAVASDGHYGEPKTEYAAYYDTLVQRINEAHEVRPFAFCMINGDIIHDDKTHYPAAKAALDKLKPTYYVSQGNHDHVNAAEWESVWNMPVNLDFNIGKNTFLIATTSDETGAYLCPDVTWMGERLKANEQQENVFIFMHINPGKLTRYGVDCTALFEEFAKYKNIRGVFNGHDHDEEGIKIRADIPFIFDAHFGGSWGTSYRGFRIVEVLNDNSIVTYIMNPTDIINKATL